jgi:hypothetical protein
MLKFSQVSRVEISKVWLKVGDSELGEHLEVADSTLMRVIPRYLGTRVDPMGL